PSPPLLVLPSFPPRRSPYLPPRHFQLAISHPPVMMAAILGALETSHCLAHRKPLRQLAPCPRSAAAACFRFSACGLAWPLRSETDRKSTRLNSSHVAISYAV